jgi:hypothetical protein
MPFLISYDSLPLSLTCTVAFQSKPAVNVVTDYITTSTTTAIVLYSSTPEISTVSEIDFFCCESMPLSLICTSAFQSEPTGAPSIWKQEGPAIVGDTYFDTFGASVALSANAKTLVIGAPIYYVNTVGKIGYVKVYSTNEDDGDRVQLGQTIYGDAAQDLFGYSVDITADGMSLAIASPGYYLNKDRLGYVRVFSLKSSTWEQVGSDITGEAIGDAFGRSVSISDDGKMVAVGASFNNENGEQSGHVRIYRLEDNGMSWVQVGEDIDGEAAWDESGESVSLSANGTTVAFGAAGASKNGVRTGQVRVYRIDSEGLGWEQLGQSIYGDYVDDRFGQSVNISPDGQTLAIGSTGYLGNNDRPGYVKVFSLDIGTDLGSSRWEQIGQDITGRAIGDGFGRSVSLSDDGGTLAIGAPFANGKNGDNSGYVAVYQMDDSGLSWKQLGEVIDGEAGGDYSGVSLSLSADGEKVVIGSYWSDDNGPESGHVRVFVIE